MFTKIKYFLDIYEPVELSSKKKYNWKEVRSCPKFKNIQKQELNLEQECPAT